MKEIINIFEEVVKLQAAGTPAALCVLTRVEGSSPQITGAKMIVTGDGKILGTTGGGAIEKKLTELCLEVIKTGVPQSAKFHLVKDLGMACGGEAEAYIEPIEGRGHLVIFGGGHIAQPMALTAKMLGFRVSVIDDRKEWASRERFPTVDDVIVSDWLPYLASQKFGKNDHLLIVTRGHEHDQTILEQVTRGEFAWLGMIGSKRKVGASFDRLRKAGIPEAVIARVESPVGLDIGAISPEEIAISVAARLVQVRRKAATAPTTALMNR